MFNRLSDHINFTAVSGELLHCKKKKSMMQKYERAIFFTNDFVVPEEYNFVYAIENLLPSDALS